MSDFEVNITECTLPVMCKDCTKIECGHHGKREADCPKYRCDRPDPWKRQCDTCAWLDKWYEEMKEGSE